MPRQATILSLIALMVLTLLASPARAAGDSSSWPGMLGPGYDGAVRNAKLATGSGDLAASLTWKRDLGSGYSVVAAGEGRVFALFSTAEGNFAAGFDQKTGNELWRYRIEDIYKGHDGSHDGPISSPALGAGRLFGLSPRGVLFALDAATGKAAWTKDLVAELGAKSPFYGFTSSPILVNNTLVLGIGAGEGKAIAGFAADDGKLLWSAGSDEIHYSSPIVAGLGGRPQIVAAGAKTLWGLDPANGKELWSYEHQGDENAVGGQKVIPVPAGEGRFLLTNKQDSSTMIQVAPGADGAYKVSEIWTNNSIRSTFVIPVYHEGHIYGVSGRILTCVDAATGETKWKSRDAGDGFVTLVGRHLVILTKAGTLHIAEASPAGYKELARMALFDENAWSAVAYADGHLFARSMAHLARIDVTAGAAAPAVAVAGGSWVKNTGFGRFLAEVEKAPDKTAAVDAYLEKQASFPIVESDGAVHFVYRGKATDVAILGDMLGGSREDAMQRLSGTDLFHYSMRLEPDAAVTYGYVVDYGQTPAADALNPSKASGNFGDISLLTMPAYRTAPPTAPAETARQGRMEAFEFAYKSGDKDRKLTTQIYLPAGYDARSDARYPTLYVHRGKNALERGKMKDQLDALIGTRVDPLIAVFVYPDPDNPAEPIDSYVQMVATELVPRIDQRYRTIAQPLARASVGFGGGGGPALSCALKNPTLFQRLGSLSAFVISRKDFETQVPAAETQPLVVWLGWGSYGSRSRTEGWDTAQGNRDLWGLLRERGHHPSGGEKPVGSSWNIWPDQAGEMIAALFPRRKP